MRLIPHTQMRMDAFSFFLQSFKDKESVETATNLENRAVDIKRPIESLKIEDNRQVQHEQENSEVESRFLSQSMHQLSDCALGALDSIVIDCNDTSLP